MSYIEIFLSSDKVVELHVKLEDDTVWLTQAQIVDLFQSSKANISEHVQHIFVEGELEREPTVRKFRTVQKEGKRQVSREIEHYNLDLILSIGYRINSKRGTQFRQWASERLKEHLIKGYTINEERIRQLEGSLSQLEQTIKLIHQSSQADQINLSEAKGLLDIISNYTRSFILLNQFDSNRLELEKLNENISYEISYEEAVSAIEKLKKILIDKREASALFGNQKDESFAGILGNVVQSFGGEYVYSSIEEQAAHLLYFIIKNHPFSDGNKRIAAFIFIWFLEKNHHRFKKSGEVKINDNGLTALTLLVAQSEPKDKDLMIKLIINLINL
jgi:death-on-curing family protein